MRLLAALLLLGGCDLLFQLERIDLANQPDAGIDPQRCFGHDFAVICLPAGPTGTGLLAGEIDTTACTSSGGSLQTTTSDTRVLCVIAHESIQVSALRVAGNYPLVLIARTALSIDGVVDASSHHPAGGGMGPGATNAACGVSNGVDDFFGTGGAGGSSAARGGAGGGANGAGNVTQSLDAIVLADVRAGCRAGSGGSTTTTQGGNGGAGGGAVYLIAGDSLAITTNGALLVGGEGGKGGQASAGGGGGGAGGLVMLDAPVVRSDGVLCANGGGGGGGGQGANGGDGCASAIMTAAGGTAGASGGAGGAGSSQSSPVGAAGASGTLSKAGGGGGGAAGYIRIVSPDPLIDFARTSPPAS